MPEDISEDDVETLRLPRNWKAYARRAVLNVVGIVRVAMLAGREALIETGNSRDARIHQLESEVAILREELRINGARMQRIPPQQRPQYSSVDRMAILQLRAMRGWNKTETARHFFVSDDTVRAWLRRAEDDSLSIDPTKRSAARRRTRFTSYVHRQTNNLVWSLAASGRAGRHVQNRRSTFKASPATR